MRWIVAALIGFVIASAAWRGGWPIAAIGAAALAGFALGMLVGAEIERGRR